MLKELRKSNLITNPQISEFDLGEERAHRAEFIRYLREIPPGFLSIAMDPKKQDIVRTHLRKVYMRKPDKSEVAIVLDRVLNLADFIKVGREAVENKTGQHSFKKEHWGHVKRCVFCGHEFKTFEEVSLDHIIPLSLGGPEKPENWQLTCKLCNVQKDGYWGCADLSRIETFRKVQGQFFNLSEAQALAELGMPKNPTRYWVLERDLCKCSDCHLSSADEKMTIARRDPELGMTIDNLAIFCVICAKKKKLQYVK
jgi:5-methylcytosine-specific restriction endonuclease McrA